MTGLSLEQLRALAGDREVTDVACPACGPGCKSEINKRRRVLRIWDNGTLVTYTCARCGIAGWVRDGSGHATAPRRKAEPAVPDVDRSEIARLLWARSAPLLGSLAETYLRHRGCFVDSENLRFLPARGEHHAAMIARFGVGPLTGIHLTRLKSDGRGKAGTDKDKIMIGPSRGQPIMIHDNPERGELVISEGIEDAASVAGVMGWSARAAGAAGRIPHIVADARGFERVYLAFDDDIAGRNALKQARIIRPDIVPINFSKILAYREKIDANSARAKFGDDVVLASIEWSDARARYVAKEIGFEQMQRLTERARNVFSQLDPAETDRSP